MSRPRSQAPSRRSAPYCRPVALLGMRPAFEDQGHELGAIRADRRGVAADALDRPLGVAPVRTWHVLGDRRVPAASGP